MMLAVHTPNEMLAALPKPQLQTVSRCQLFPNDCLVVCGGFEDRAVAILKGAVSGRSAFNVVLIAYEPLVPENRGDVIRRMCEEAGIRIVELVYNRQEPTGFGSVLIEALSAYHGRIFVDISGMSRLLIVQSLVAFRKRPQRFSNCYVAYAEAQQYPPTQKEADAELAKSDSDASFSTLFLSSGVFDVTLVPELASYAPSVVQTRLVVFPSLDAHQLIALRAELLPSRISFIEGVPPDLSNRWRRDAVALANRLDQIPNAERYQTSTLDYRETLSCLQELYSKHEIRERLLISPTGSKMQAVAVGIFRSFVEDVQIVYPTPRSFLSPSKYTHGIGRIHLLPLEPLSSG